MTDFFPGEIHPLHTEEHLNLPLLLRAQEIRNVSKQLCEEAAVAQEQAREIMQICLLAQQRHRDVRELSPVERYRQGL